LMVIMNDPDYLQSYTNGWITNVAVAVVVLIAVVLAVLSVPLQFLGG
jgi:hypothetical protein